jgi:hypothetical protein
LSDTEFFATTQGKSERDELLGLLHIFTDISRYGKAVEFWEIIEMHTFSAGKSLIDMFRNKWNDRRGDLAKFH